MSIKSDRPIEDLILLVRNTLKEVGLYVEGEMRVARKEGLEQYVVHKTVASLLKLSAFGNYGIEASEVRIDGVEDYPFYYYYMLIEAEWSDSTCAVFLRVGQEEIINDDLSLLSTRYDRVYDRVNTAMQKLDKIYRQAQD